MDPLEPSGAGRRELAGLQERSTELIKLAGPPLAAGVATSAAPAPAGGGGAPPCRACCRDEARRGLAACWVPS